jgi:DNA-binding PadR family transcriptional regulator
MSGYDIKQSLKDLSWLIGSPSFGSLYPALHALVEDGFATVEAVAGDHKPKRNVYTITETGRQVLQTWIDQSVEPDVSLKGFVMRLLLADAFSHNGLVATLQQRRAEIAGRCGGLEAVSADQSGGELVQGLAADYGLAIAEAELAWLESKLDHLGVERDPDGKRDDSKPLEKGDSSIDE